MERPRGGRHSRVEPPAGCGRPKTWVLRHPAGDLNGARTAGGAVMAGKSYLDALNNMNQCMITFRSGEIARDFVNEGGWKEFFETVNDGVFSWGEIDISAGYCFVLTESGKKIEEEFNLSWKNRVYPVWVSDVGDTWTLEFGVTLPRMETDGKDDVLEDGEFRPPPQPPAGGKTTSREAESTGCIDMGGTSQNTHVTKVAAHVDISAHASSEEMSSPGRPSIMVDQHHIGPSIDMGHSSAFNSKKKTHEIQKPRSGGIRLGSYEFEYG
ncbi:hypothetical protein L1987_78799 [Smallanthus sonchifolius]|uniref:Uncharacterized protein n=1 Tax=Smallanthus sonchifolius TaxID=185202 RepID=A0ACB8ZCS2_9ASTR|nr:hypothetical protein L1987_78799 [Smallanthus sonchifolius]